ncbi:MAG: hypothetical protein ACLPN1_16510 [Dissulfurispiraceae bacterium]
MDFTTVLNLILSLTILVLGIKRYFQSGVKAFAFIGIGFFMFAISHFALLMGWAADLKSVLPVVRAAGYIFVILGLVM